MIFKSGVGEERIQLAMNQMRVDGLTDDVEVKLFSSEFGIASEPTEGGCSVGYDSGAEKTR